MKIKQMQPSMRPLLFVNDVKLIELKRLLVYSKGSCNIPTNTHGRSVKSLAAICIQQDQAGQAADKEV